MRVSLFHRIVLATGSLIFAAGLEAASGQKAMSFKTVHRGPIDPRASMLIDNAYGSVKVVGTNENVLEIVTVRNIRGADDEAIEEAKNMVIPRLQGNPKSYILRSEFRPGTKKWSAAVSYLVKVPASVELRIVSHSGEGIVITDMKGGLSIKNVNGPIRIERAASPMRVESINGTVTVVYKIRPTVNAFLSSINGDVEVIVPQDAAFAWVAETLKGDFVSTVQARGSVSRVNSGTVYRATVNGSSIPNIHTVSLTGKVALVTAERQAGIAPSLLASIAPPPKAARPSNDMAREMTRVSNTLLLQPPTARTFVAQQSVIDGNFRFETSLGNIFLGEIRGDANISTRAGEIVIGKVTATCQASSQGGPINLGDIAGDLQARTGAGDIHVRAARSGGVINTEGGSVHVLHAGGPIDIRSGGGDLTLRNAASRVRAQTKQGDINITVDPKLRTTAIDASTVGGNVILNVPPGFAGDFDISIVTNDVDADRIHLDVKGLTIQKDQFAGRTRIRARGKVNGGGEKVQILVDGGDVHVRTATPGALAMKQK